VVADRHLRDAGTEVVAMAPKHFNLQTAEASMRAVTTPEISVNAKGWRAGVPSVRGELVELRELRASDAESLCELLGAQEVRRFISPPPSSSNAFARFIDRAEQMRVEGHGLCLAVTLRGQDEPIGLFQLRETEPPFRTAEWGFAIASSFWSTGVFEEAAELVMMFAFEHLGVHRLEARAVITNGRGTNALKKLGAVQEGVLRRSFLRDGEYLDQALYAIVDDDWRATRRVPKTMVH
jgi:RimJ/RimL family protein N-acetyltransferase